MRDSLIVALWHGVDGPAGKPPDILKYNTLISRDTAMKLRKLTEVLQQHSRSASGVV